MFENIKKNFRYKFMNGFDMVFSLLSNPSITSFLFFEKY